MQNFFIGDKLLINSRAKHVFTRNGTTSQYLQIQPNQFPVDFQDAFQQTSGSFQTVMVLWTWWSCLLDKLYLALLSFSWQLPGTVANQWDDSDRAYSL